MTFVDDISMFDSNFGHQPASSQPHLDSFEDYSFALDAAHTTSCSHRALQEVLNSGDPMTRMANISKGQSEQAQTSQTTTASSSDTEIERLKREVMDFKRESQERGQKLEKLYEMFVSLVNTVAKQGVAIEKMIKEMSPDRSENFFRSLKEELQKLPTNVMEKDRRFVK